MLSSHQNGRSAIEIAKKLGVTLESINAKFDDGNPAWEDVVFDNEDEEEFELRCNGQDLVPEDVACDNMALVVQHTQLVQSLASKLASITFRQWQGHWSRQYSMVKHKTRWLHSLQAGEHPEGPPHTFFTHDERSFITSLLTSGVILDANGWYELPGPAAWWPDNYDFEKWGLAPESDKAMARGRLMALQILKYGMKEENFAEMSIHRTECAVFPRPRTAKQELVFQKHGLRF